MIYVDIFSLAQEIIWLFLCAEDQMPNSSSCYIVFICRRCTWSAPTAGPRCGSVLSAGSLTRASPGDTGQWSATSDDEQTISWALWSLVSISLCSLWFCLKPTLWEIDAVMRPPQLKLKGLTDTIGTLLKSLRVSLNFGCCILLRVLWT